MTATQTATDLRALLDHQVMIDSALGTSQLTENFKGCLFCSDPSRGTAWWSMDSSSPPANWHHTTTCALLPWISVMRVEDDA